jgi:hypothetical protein
LHPGSQYASIAPPFAHYGVALWTPEAGGRSGTARHLKDQLAVVLMIGPVDHGDDGLLAAGQRGGLRTRGGHSSASWQGKTRGRRTPGCRGQEQARGEGRTEHRRDGVRQHVAAAAPEDGPYPVLCSM